MPDDTHFIELKARAKINLSLDVINKRTDGYHNIETIMQTIKLYDKITISRVSKEIEIVCEKNCRLSEDIPRGDENIAFKAAKLFKKRYSIDSGVKIRIEKNIPVAAGLAGGSTNAASVLIGMNKLFGCGALEEDIITIGREIGADVPFCVRGGTVFAQGIGDILTKLKPLPLIYILIVVPNIKISTGWVYEEFDLNAKYKRPKMNFLLDAIQEGKIDQLASNMVNVLENVTARTHVEIFEIKNQLNKLGAMGSVMSGSGPSVFGIFGSKYLAEKAKDKLALNNWNVILTETL
jgi:4-diphosphocytidyl-2-C-methyl-D-erythritol kinase